MANDPLSIAQSMGIQAPGQDALELIAFAAEKMRDAGGAVIQVGPSHFETTHRFTPGLYSRTVKVVGPALMASVVHKTEHQFVISLGECYVWRPGHGVEMNMCGHVGITTPGTFRLVFVPVECQCTTFHATTLTDPKAIMAEISELPSFLSQ